MPLEAEQLPELSISRVPSRTSGTLREPQAPFENIHKPLPEALEGNGG